MKKIILFIAMWAFGENVFPQATQLLASSGLSETGYLASPNGQYKFHNVPKTIDGASWRFWVLTKVATGEELFTSKGRKVGFPVNCTPTLVFNVGYSFKGVACQPAVAGVQCQQFINYPNGYLGHIPFLFSYCWSGFGTSLQYHGPFDMIGIPSAYQNTNAYAHPEIPKVAVPSNDEVYVKNAATGVYTVPVSKQAYAMKLLDDGNMVIVNNVGAILWETATGVQQLIDTRLNKKFKDVNTNFTKGIGLLAQGNVELSNTQITQDAASAVFIAHTYVLLQPGTGYSSLNATAANGYIELKCIPGAPITAARSTNLGAVAPVAQATDKTSPLLTAYPNPTTGMVKFSTGQADERIVYISILDLTGRYSLQRYADTDKADLAGLAPGAYLYKVVTNKDTYNGKLVKQ